MCQARDAARSICPVTQGCMQSSSPCAGSPSVSPHVSSRRARAKRRFQAVANHMVEIVKASAPACAATCCPGATIRETLIQLVLYSVPRGKASGEVIRSCLSDTSMWSRHLPHRAKAQSPQSRRFVWFYSLLQLDLSFLVLAALAKAAVQ